MKEINGKHYVDGGPACYNVYWIYYPEDRCPTCATPLHEAYPGHDEKCSKCHGTGVIPVEDWPDAVKAEWLWDQGYAWKPDRIMQQGKWTYFIFYQTFKEREPMKSTDSTDDFSQALTAAVIAVAKEVAA